MAPKLYLETSLGKIVQSTQAVVPFVAIFALTASAIDVTGAPFSHENFNHVLETFVDSKGRVDYERLQRRPLQLHRYIDSLAHYSPESHPQRFADPEDRLAYWLNAYNAFVIRGVIDAYPVDSVRKIGTFNSFFEGRSFNAGGEHLTLDYIQNGIIRAEFRDSRIHFALNCGTIGCPPLANKAYVGDTLEQDLEAAMTRFCSDRKNVLLNQEKNRLFLSKLFDWYTLDFAVETQHDTTHLAGLVKYLLPLLLPTDRNYLRHNPDINIMFTKYDWTLNRQRPRTVDP